MDEFAKGNRKGRAYARPFFHAEKPSENHGKNAKKEEHH